ncbi:hypothetical protein [Stieleria neptunia]|nr:hypothetical protein [Stieleria neptunia]
MIRSIWEIAAIVCLRFPVPIRAWAIAVALTNLASLLFLGTLEGRVVLLALIIAISIMAMIHQRLGFVRLLGAGHVTWLVMLPWLLMRLPSAASNPAFHGWLVALLVLNSICLMVDTADVIRFFRGERDPHYRL